MADLGLVTLGSLRLQIQQRADIVTSNFFTTSELNGYADSSYKELYDLLVTTFGDDYYVAPPYQFQTVANTQKYPLPDGVTITSADTGLVAPSFYKLLGVDLQVNPSQVDGWTTLTRFEFTDRNKWWLANTYNVLGYSNLKYKLMGNYIWFTPLPQAGQTVQLWYVPQAANLQSTVICSFTSNSTAATANDTSGLTVGMQLDNTNLTAGTTIASITDGTHFVLSATANATAASQVTYAWNDGFTFECVDGWEEYIIVDAAIKCALKQEDDPSALFAMKAALVKRINESAPNRDAAIAPTVSDTLRLESGGLFGADTPGWGGDGW